MAPSNVGGPGSGPAHSRPPAEASAAPPARARAKAGTSAWVLGCGTVYRDAMPCAHACAREHAALTPAGLTAHKQSNCAQRPGNGSIGSAAGEEAGRTGKEAAGRCVGRAQWSGCGGQAQGGRQGKGSGRVLRLCARRACLRACTQMRWARVHAHASMCAWPHADMQRERGRERGGEREEKAEEECSKCGQARNSMRIGNAPPTINSRTNTRTGRRHIDKCTAPSHYNGCP